MTGTQGICIRQTDLPSTTRLFADLLYDFDRVREFYRYPTQVDAIAEAAQGLEFDPRHRQELVRSLSEGNRGPQADAHLDLLAQPGTVAVATGQQVGLYGGPVFTLYKALSALKLAEGLRRRGTPAVAVFWLATEDHDLAEVDHSWVLNHRGESVKLQAVAQPKPDEPVGSVGIDDAAYELLGEALAGLPFGEQACELARDSYAPGATFRSGFQALYQRLLSRYGLIFLDPMSAGMRRLATPLFQEALSRTPELNQALIARSEALESAGYHAQVRVTEETSLLFLVENGQRVALHRSAERYQSANGSYSTDELLRRLGEDPGSFSPNALLRPVTQDFLLPTAAYVGGPAELAYLAQAEVVYRRLLGRMPVVLPRASLTVLDSRAARLFERYQLTLRDCFDGPAALRRKIAEKLIPANLENTLAASQTRIHEALGSVEQELLAFDPTLAAALTNTSKKIFYQYGKIRDKAAQESLRRDDRAERDANSLSELIFPNKMPQERVYGVLSFLARHGFDFVERLYETIQPDCHDHQVWIA